MKIKTKLRWGVGLLFVLITCLAVLAVRQVNALASDAANVLEANYNSLDYSRKMLRALNEKDQQSMYDFEQNLEKQKRNTTEIGEKEITDQLAGHYQELKREPGNPEVLIRLRRDINEIMALNMNAIGRKSLVAEQTAENSIVWIAITGTLCFLIAFTLFVNLPGNVANPIRELTGSIRQIAKENYSERVHFTTGDEFEELAASFNTMAEKLEEYNNSNLARLMIEKKRIDTLIANMHDPVIGLDENRVVLFANEEALKISGLRAEELIGKSSMEVALGNDLIRSLVQDTLEGPTREERSTQMKIFADGKESYFEKENVPISFVPAGDKLHREIGNVIILRNVTPYKELDFAKTNFIATVSHELKTPISSIKMSLELLQNEGIGPTNEEQKALVDSIREDADRLLKITGELLAITQVESGKIALTSSSVPLQEILEYAVDANEVLAGSRSVRIRMAVARQDWCVWADPEKTAWVLTNLINNAIRYSHDHSEISLSVAEEGQFIKVAVTDSGKGIAPEYRDRIFDRYFRVPGSDREGTGLGLAISREFMEAQGGYLTVESELGTGSTFALFLKRAEKQD